MMYFSKNIWIKFWGWNQKNLQKYIKQDYKASSELWYLTTYRDIENLSGSLVLNSNAILDYDWETIASFFKSWFWQI